MKVPIKGLVCDFGLEPKRLSATDFESVMATITSIADITNVFIQSTISDSVYETYGYFSVHTPTSYLFCLCLHYNRFKLICQ